MLEEEQGAFESHEGKKTKRARFRRIDYTFRCDGYPLSLSFFTNVEQYPERSMYAFPDLPRDEARRVGRCSRVFRDIYGELSSGDDAAQPVRDTPQTCSVSNVPSVYMYR